ncbi:MAG: AlpA family phage regulatory protein [Deltaproteobacteria bacterium]|nr:AlpA family phage regulatory protein [Deltaproteobacteria bacterium]
MHKEFLRFPEVRAVTKLSRSTIWRLEAKGDFPQRRLIGAKSVGWINSEILAWVESRQPVVAK